MSNIDRFNSELEQTTNDLSSFNRILLKNSNLILNSNASKIAEEELQASEKFKELKGVAKNASAQFGTFTKSLLNSGSSFEPLASMMELITGTIGGFLGALGPIGAIFGAATKGAGDVAAHMIRSMDKAYASFEKMSQNGVVSSFSDMQIAGVKLGMSISEMETLFTKSSKDIALLGGSAVAGRVKLEELGIYSREARKQMQRLGISALDFTEFQISALNQKQRYQGTQVKIDEDAVKTTSSYVLELKSLSDITGMSMKQHDSLNKKLMNDPRWIFGIQGNKEFTKEGKENALRLFNLLEGAPKQQEFLLEALQSTGVITGSDKGAASDILVSLTSVGYDLQDQRKKLASGKLNEFEFLKNFYEAGKKANDTIKEGNRMSNKLEDYGYETFVEMEQSIAKFGKLTKERYNERLEENERISKLPTGKSAEMGDTKTYMRETQITMEQLSTNSDTVAGLMNVMSATLGEFIDYTAKAAGKPIEKSVGLRRELIRVQKDISDLKPGYAEYTKDRAETIRSMPKMVGSSWSIYNQALSEKEYEKKLQELETKQHDIKMSILDNDIQLERKKEDDLTVQQKVDLENYRKNNPSPNIVSTPTPVGTTGSTSSASTSSPSPKLDMRSLLGGNISRSAASPTSPKSTTSSSNNASLSISVPSGGTEVTSGSNSGRAQGGGYATGGVVQNSNESDQSNKGTEASQRSLPGSLNITSQDNKHIENMSADLSDKFSILIDLLESSNSTAKRKMQATMA
jgi:hypothetical protein